MKTLCPLLLACAGLAAADPVAWRVETMTFPVEIGDTGRRGSKEANPDGYYPVRPSLHVVQKSVEVVVVSNEFVEAWICPAWGARLLRARDRKTGADYFGWKEPLEGRLAWTPGGVKASFPFFEHGLHLEQPAGWRVVTGADGSVTVAMDLRFTQFQEPRDSLRYGRYGDESLAIAVTIAPGSSAIRWWQRKDNPNPLPRGDRFWNDAAFPCPVITRPAMVRDKKTGQEVEKQVPDQAALEAAVRFIFPARWVVDHGPSQVHTSPHWSAPLNWNVSHFSIDAPYGFSGGWYPGERINRLRINDTAPGRGPATKLWNSPGAAMFEIWGGEGIVFEKPGALQPAWKPVAFSHRFWIAQGIGEVDWADDDLALAIEDDGVGIVASRPLSITVDDGAGRALGAGPVGPHTVLTVPPAQRVRVRAGERVLLDRAFPLDRPVPAKETPVPAEIQAAFAALVAPDPQYLEKQCVARNEGQPGLTDAIGVAKGLLADPAAAAANLDKMFGLNGVGAFVGKPELALSLARACQRLGQLDLAAQLCARAPGPEADLVLGLIALERGEATDFGAAGIEADPLRALARIRAGDRPGAVALVDRHLARVPDAWYPRLWRALWTQDAAAAGALAAENPASPEAQFVLKELGRPNDFDRLVAGNPHADVHCALFAAQALRGEWKPLPRYPVK